MDEEYEYLGLPPKPHWFKNLEKAWEANRKAGEEKRAAIAKKGLKEVSYHLRFSSDWVKRLGDGTSESHQKMQEAIDDRWLFVNEMFLNTDADIAMIEAGIGVDVSELKEEYHQKVAAILTEATLSIPDEKYFQKGGKQGIHSEHMGFILAELQYMQKSYPNLKW